MKNEDIETTDKEHKKSSKYKYFKDEIKSILYQFETSKEWADIIKCLDKMKSVKIYSSKKKVLKKFKDIPIIPEDLLISKRLTQCLHSSLPAGVFFLIIKK
jgi:murein L,D-transpeptidase YafK